MISVLVTRMHCRLILAYGKHLGENTGHSLKPYSTSMKSVDAEIQIPLSGLYKSSCGIIKEFGEEGNITMDCCQDGPTSFSKEGRSHADG